MLTVYCDLHKVYMSRSRQGKLTPTFCISILNSRTSLLRALGHPTDSLQFASHYRSSWSTHVNWYPTPCSAANKKHPEHGIKVGSKPEFDV